MTNEIKKGLAGVVVDTTQISKVDAETNSLLYRGYSVAELSEKCRFEEVAYLLWYGELPDDAELESFTESERGQRALSVEVRDLVDRISPKSHPMDVLRTAVSFIGAQALDGSSDADSVFRKGLQVFAAVPAIIAYDQRRRRGLDLIPARADLSYSENFLWMTFGELPAKPVVDAFDVSMILYAEHSFNASTFTARTVTSTNSDYYSSITAAIGALKGNLHGGANEAVLETMEEIGFGANPAERAARWLNEALETKRKIMGFGHRVYKNGDSRVPTMKKSLEQLVLHYQRPDVIELYNALEGAMDEAKGIKPNLDFPSGPAYYLMGFDTPVFTPLFVASRITGWTAHIVEQSQNNALIRPLSEYTGFARRDLA
jgi:2-methylcitrate synthase/citrate synthase II